VTLTRLIGYIVEFVLMTVFVAIGTFIAFVGVYGIFVAILMFLTWSTYDDTINWLFFIRVSIVTGVIIGLWYILSKEAKEAVDLFEIWIKK